VLLLYEEERPMYHSWHSSLTKPRDKSKSIEPRDVYGLEHFVRLFGMFQLDSSLSPSLPFSPSLMCALNWIHVIDDDAVKLPNFMEHATLSPLAEDVIKEKLDSLLFWILKKSKDPEYFMVRYDTQLE
jgi:hypothetical protein